ncbi:2-oxoacid:ferredoxin oxidoreductase subunit beta, partial [Nanoarchaeota archaeon]
MLGTKEEITWCPGCTNFGILNAVKRAVGELIKEKKLRQREVVTVTGIGCHAKIYDYLNLSGFYSIHGRVLPTALGIKVGNPRLTVIGFGGDGDTYAEG